MSMEYIPRSILCRVVCQGLEKSCACQFLGMLIRSSPSRFSKSCQRSYGCVELIEKELIFLSFKRMSLEEIEKGITSSPCYCLRVKERRSQNRGFSIVIVIGFRGLGKSTLARLVYKDERFKQGFDWVLIEIIESKEERHCELGLEKLQEIKKD
ncbi:hypothetical protein V2J09_021493 [Rumex salicifolius]